MAWTGWVGAETAGLVPNPHIPGIPGPITFHHNHLPVPKVVPKVPKVTPHAPSPAGVTVTAVQARHAVTQYIQIHYRPRPPASLVITGAMLTATATVEQQLGTQPGLSTYLWAMRVRGTQYFLRGATFYVDAQTVQVIMMHVSPPSPSPAAIQ